VPDRPQFLLNQRTPLQSQLDPQPGIPADLSAEALISRAVYLRSVSFDGEAYAIFRTRGIAYVASVRCRTAVTVARSHHFVCLGARLSCDVSTRQVPLLLVKVSVNRRAPLASAPSMENVPVQRPVTTPDAPWTRNAKSVS